MLKQKKQVLNSQLQELTLAPTQQKSNAQEDDEPATIESGDEEGGEKDEAFDNNKYLGFNVGSSVL